MLRRLILLLALLLVPAIAAAQHIVPQLVAEGPTPPGGEVELAIHMRPQQGWHGYWQNPGDAGLPMKVDWQLPKGFAVGPLRYPVPDPPHRRRADELRVRARLCRPRSAPSAGERDRDGACPRPGSLARLHRADLRPGAGRTLARSAGRQRGAEPRRVRRVAAAACPADRHARPFRTLRRQASRRHSAAREREGREALRLPHHRQRRGLRSAAVVQSVRRLSDRRIASEGSAQGVRRRARVGGRPRTRIPRASRRGSRRRQPGW